MCIWLKINKLKKIQMKHFLFYLFDIKSILSSKTEGQQKANQRLDISNNKYLDDVHISFFRYFLVYKMLHAYTILVAFSPKSMLELSICMSLLSYTNLNIVTW